MNGIPEVQMCEGAPIVSPSTLIEKKCTKCGMIKLITEFHKDKSCRTGRQIFCKKCNKEYQCQWRPKNKEKRLNYKKKYAGKEENKEKIKKYMRKYMRKYMAVYSLNPTRRLNDNIKSAVWSSLKGNKAGRKWENLVGYTVDQLKKHLEKQFQPGMTWDNYGGWQVDHKIPLRVFNFRKSEDLDFKKAWAFSNLQPLWKKDNLSKGGKINNPFQPSLVF